MIFDMDGVLLDTERIYTEVTQRIVARWGKTFDWSVKADMVGRPALDSARHLVQALALPITAEEYLAERERALEDAMPLAEPLPGARELTESLAGRGIPMALASSSSRRLFALKTRRHGAWFETFGAIVLGDDPAVRRGKPAPDIFLVAAERLGAAPERCVVVEDAPAGVAAAKSAGMRVVAVPDAAMNRLVYRDADLVVDGLLGLHVDALLG